MYRTGRISADQTKEYSGEYNRDKLEKWVRDFMYKNSGKKVLIRELSKSVSLTGKCGAGDSMFCFIWMMEKDDKTCFNAETNDFDQPMV